MAAAAHDTTSAIQGLLDRLGSGRARDSDRVALLDRARGRLEALTHRMLRRYPGVARWEQTDDVLQNAMVRLDRALKDDAVATALHFFRLASVQIRRELIDLARHYNGPEGLGANHSSRGGGDDAGSAGGGSPDLDPPTPTDDPGRLAAWTDFHEAVGRLDDEDREVWDLLWYQGLTQEEAGEALGVSASTVNRRWMKARLVLGRLLGGHFPD